MQDRKSGMPAKSTRSSQRALPSHLPLIQRKSTCSCGGYCPSCSGIAIQPKLNVSSPNDRYEREADKVAAQVVGLGAAAPEISMLDDVSALYRLSTIESPTEEDTTIAPDSGLPLADEEDSQLQRLAVNGSNEAEQKNPPVQRLKIVGPAKGSHQATQQVFQRRLASTRNQGAPLPPAQRRFMESRFKRDFSEVRIHDGAQAKHLSTDIRARAFTFGQNIYFNQGEYQPETPSGKNVLAHELTHVVQQGAATTRAGKTSGVKKAIISESADPDPSDKKVNRMPAITPGATPDATGVQPWSTPHPLGSDYTLQTDGGSNVSGWVAYSPYVNNLRYWCHGFSLGTYQNNVMGYSVYSGRPMRTVIKDEWKAIPSARARPGDLAVWTKFQHSAKFTSITKKSTGGLDESASLLDSKNGQAPLDKYTMSQLIAVPQYGPSYRVYRRR